VVHSIIKKEASAQVTYLPLTKYFVKNNGDLNTTYCSGDGIHLIAPGYELWAKVLKETIDKVILK
jgi:lysophospholipase L1-like esterase